MQREENPLQDSPPEDMDGDASQGVLPNTKGATQRVFTWPQGLNNPAKSYSFVSQKKKEFTFPYLRPLLPLELCLQ